MTDTLKLEAAKSSAEEVAYQLLIEIQKAEGVFINAQEGKTKLSRQWILDTYAECLEATKGYRSVPKV